jgi:hypothetical protein
MKRYKVTLEFNVILEEMSPPYDWDFQELLDLPDEVTVVEVKEVSL